MTTTPGPAPADPVPELPQARRDAVHRARTEWRKRLIDTSRRNNLLYFRDLKVGTLDVAMGMATWTAGDGGRDAEAAVKAYRARP